MLRLNYYAFLSGCFAAATSICGKLLGSYALQIPIIPESVFFLVLMIVCNVAMWTLYAKALQAADSALTPTVLSATSNYCLSALAGILFFGEVTSLLWWSGMVLVLCGLILVAQDEAKGGHQVLREVKRTVKVS